MEEIGQFMGLMVVVLGRFAVRRDRYRHFRRIVSAWPSR